MGGSNPVPEKNVLYAHNSGTENKELTKSSTSKQECAERNTGTKKDDYRGIALMLEAPPPPQSCIINIVEYLERTKGFEHLMKKDGLLEDIQELKMFEKRIVSKDTVIRSLMSLVVKPQRVIKGNGFFMWDVLLPTTEACLEIAKRELMTTDILWTEYDGRLRTK